MTAAEAERVARQNFGRRLGVLLCKTHRWVLLVHDRNGLRWTASDDKQLSIGQHGTLEELMHDIVTNVANVWSLHAVTEPALANEDAHLGLDLLIPLRAGARDNAMASAVTPSKLIQTYYTYAARTADIMDYDLHLRVFPEMKPEALPMQINFPKSKVAQNGLLLCNNLDVSRRLEMAYKPDSALWFSRGLMEFYPCPFYQRITGTPNGYSHYCVAAPDGLVDAELLMDKELETLETYVHDQGDARLSDSTLFRVMSPDTDTFIDIYSRGNTEGIANCSMLKLDRRYMIMLCMPSITTYSNVKADMPTQQLILDLHKQDALAPLLELCGKE